jgi:hypothetical protein
MQRSVASNCTEFVVRCLRPRSGRRAPDSSDAFHRHLLPLLGRQCALPLGVTLFAIHGVEDGSYDDLVRGGVLGQQRHA